MPELATTARRPLEVEAKRRPLADEGLGVTVADCHPDRCTVAGLVDEIAAEGFPAEAVLAAAVAACDGDDGCWLARQPSASAVPVVKVAAARGAKDAPARAAFA